MFTWILKGASERDILEAIQTLWPGQDPKPLIIDAIKQFETAASQRLDVVIGWCYEAYRELYRRMLEIGDFTGALRAVKMVQDLASKGR